MRLAGLYVCKPSLNKPTNSRCTAGSYDSGIWCSFRERDEELSVTDVRVSVDGTEVWRLCGTARPLPVLRGGHAVHVRFYSRPVSDDLMWENAVMCARDLHHQNAGFRLLFTFHPVSVHASVFGLLFWPFKIITYSSKWCGWVFGDVGKHLVRLRTTGTPAYGCSSPSTL